MESVSAAIRAASHIRLLPPGTGAYPFLPHPETCSMRFRTLFHNLSARVSNSPAMHALHAKAFFSPLISFYRTFPHLTRKTFRFRHRFLRNEPVFFPHWQAPFFQKRKHPLRRQSSERMQGVQSELQRFHAHGRTHGARQIQGAHIGALGSGGLRLVDGVHQSL